MDRHSGHPTSFRLPIRATEMTIISDTLFRLLLAREITTTYLALCRHKQPLQRNSIESRDISAPFTRISWGAVSISAADGAVAKSEAPTYEHQTVKEQWGTCTSSSGNAREKILRSPKSLVRTGVLWSTIVIILACREPGRYKYVQNIPYS